MAINTLQSNLALSREAVQKVKSYQLVSPTRQVLNGTLEKDVYTKADGYIENLRDEVDIYKDIKAKDKISALTKRFEDIIDYIEELCLNKGVGNCEEQAFIAAKYLRRKGAKKVAVLTFELPEHLKEKSPNKTFDKFKSFGEHNFVVCGLKRSASLQDPKTWGKNAVVVDPWLGIASPAVEGMELMRNATGLPQNYMKYITIEDYISEAFVPEEFYGSLAKNPYSWEWWRQDKSRG